MIEPIGDLRSAPTRINPVDDTVFTRPLAKELQEQIKVLAATISG